MNAIFRITEDGSHTLFIPEMDEHYHSTHGALAESMHVYIDAGLRQCPKKELHLLEIGFGTGLNAFLSLIEGEKQGKTIHYTALELYPLSLEKASSLNYATLVSPEKEAFFLQMHQTPWNETAKIGAHFFLQKLQRNAALPSAFVFEKQMDVVYFDAFAPDKQPEMWTQPVFDAIYSLCASDAILTTYCAKGAVRRMLQAAGFTVERLAGPVGKREILRGRK